MIYNFRSDFVETDQYKVDDPLADQRLKEIYDDWVKQGISGSDALESYKRLMNIDEEARGTV